MKVNLNLYIVALCFCVTMSFSQKNQNFEIPDSLQNKTYQELYDAYYLVVRDTAKSLVYLNTYLQKGKDEEQNLEVAKAYSFLAFYQKEEIQKLKLLDTSIYLSKASKDFKYPTIAYSFKGGHYYKKGAYRKAIDNYLLALESAYEVNNKEYIYITKHNIGRLKGRTGNYKEALLLLKECYDYENSKTPIDPPWLLASLVLLSETYTKNNQIDSSNYYINKGIGLSREIQDETYNRFVLNKGVNLYNEEKYEQAYDTIHKSLKGLSSLEDKSFLINAFFHIGKIRLTQGNIEDANVNFKKVDSVYGIINYPTPIVRETYEHFINYYKSNENVDSQLFYIEKLLKFDSIAKINNNYLKEKIVKEYDTPELLNEKEKIISSLETKNKTSFIVVSLLVGISSLTIVLLIFNLRKRKKYQQRFEELLRTRSVKKEEEISSEKIEKTSTSINIAQEIIDKILKSLQSFEKRRGFLKADITTNSLAKEFNTNSKYLSKIVNSYKQKSFSNYINDLRIDHAIDRLKDDSKFRNYTIKAISKEIGFNTTEAFSKSFHKKTGIYPSYFIKKLMERETVL